MRAAGGGRCRGGPHPPQPAGARADGTLARREGILAADGAPAVTTGARTGRSPHDRDIVDEQEADTVTWGGPNQLCSPAFFARRLTRASEYLRRREAYAFDD